MTVNVKFYITIGVIGLIGFAGLYLGTASASQPLSYIMSKPSMNMVAFAQGRTVEETCALASATRDDANRIEVMLDNGTYATCQ